MNDYSPTAKINISWIYTFFCRFFLWKIISRILLSVRVEEINLFKVKFRLHFLQLWILYLNFLVENFEISSNSIQYLGCWRCLAGVENWDKKKLKKKKMKKKILLKESICKHLIGISSSSFSTRLRCFLQFKLLTIGRKKNILNRG